MARPSGSDPARRRSSSKPPSKGGKGKPPARRSSGERAGPGVRKSAAARRAEDAARRTDATDQRTAHSGWGGVARRGARQVDRAEEPSDRGGRPGSRPTGRPVKRTTKATGDRPSASATWRKAVASARDTTDDVDPDLPSHRSPDVEEWIDHGEVRSEATSAVARAATPGGKPPARPRKARVRPEPRPERGDRDIAAATAASTATILQARLRDATRAYDRERYQDAKRVLGPLARRVPGAAAVRELHGLTLYRLGRWREAVKELEAFRSLTGSTEQHPVLADSYRALGRYTEVDELWRELREQSPSAELVAEGRIVAAGALADQDRVADAIRLLEQATKRAGKAPRHARPHHLRLWYALADLYERAGDVPRARDLFRRIEAIEPDFADVGRRVRALR